MPRTFVLAAALALLAAACTSGAPTEAPPPPEATTPAPTSTPERTPTPEPTREVQWDEDGLPLGIEGPLIVLRDLGGEVVVVTPDGQLLSRLPLDNARVALSAHELIAVQDGFAGVHVLGLDGVIQEIFATPNHKIRSAAGSHGGGYLAWVSIPGDRDDTAFFDREATFTVVNRLTGGRITIAQSELPFAGSYVLRVELWLSAVSAFAVSAGRETEAEPEWVLVQPDGIMAPAPRAFLWFSQPGGHYAYAVEGEGCLLINGTELIAEAVGGAEVFRIAANDDERLTPSAISPNGTEVLFESRSFDSHDTDCGWAESAPDLYLATAEGGRTPVDDPRPIFGRWGVLPPFDADCIDVGYPFCPSAHPVHFSRDGLLQYGDFPAIVTVLGTVDLPPP